MLRSPHESDDLVMEQEHEAPSSPRDGSALGEGTGAVEGDTAGHIMCWS